MIAYLIGIILAGTLIAGASTGAPGELVLTPENAIVGEEIVETDLSTIGEDDTRAVIGGTVTSEYTTWIVVESEDNWICVSLPSYSLKKVEVGDHVYVSGLTHRTGRNSYHCGGMYLRAKLLQCERSS